MSTRLPTVDGQNQSIDDVLRHNGKSSLERRREKRKRLPEWFRTSLPTGNSQKKFKILNNFNRRKDDDGRAVIEHRAADSS